MTNNFEKYSPEFKIKVVQLKIFGKMEADEICKKYSIDSETLNKWVEEFIEGAERKMRGKKESSKSVTEMKKRIKELEMENEILRKFNAHFSKDKKN